MRNSGRLGLALAVILVAATVFTACENPFDPLDKSDEIRGLAYIGFSLTWDQWDSEPGGDGVIATVDYFNEFGDALSFHDKAHLVIIEFYTQKSVGPEIGEDGEPVPNTGRPTFDQLIFSYPVEHDFSDADIRIPIEAYEDDLVGAGYSLEEPAVVFATVRVYPPKALPQEELVSFAPDQTVYEPDATAADPIDLP